jgi:transcriptional regulator with XRE-family HTH domain
MILGENMPKSAFNPTDKHVGSRLRMRRLMLDISQTQLGDALGITFQQVQKYEKGRNRISASRLQHLSQILQVPVPFFFEGAPAPTDVKPAAPGAAEAPSLAYVRATSSPLRRAWT